jgi:hypothetical protein
VFFPANINKFQNRTLRLTIHKYHPLMNQKRDTYSDKFLEPLSQ